MIRDFDTRSVPGTKETKKLRFTLMLPPLMHEDDNRAGNDLELHNHNRPGPAPARAAAPDQRRATKLHQLEMDNLRLKDKVVAVQLENWQLRNKEMALELENSQLKDKIIKTMEAIIALYSQQ